MSGAGTGLVGVRVERWREPSSLLGSDPPEHTVVREIMEHILLPRMRSRTCARGFEPKAEALVDSLVSAGSFDFVTDLAEVSPV